ncbi:MAG: hypothetical protein BJG00_016445 [Limnothrix sp. CACIAM 69d]|nr:MAG: hypothetical protein BJG00_016445 [Limnothrix sp. CACIAM 69d]
MTFRVKLSLHGCLATEGLWACLDMWRSPDHHQIRDTRLPPAPELVEAAEGFWKLWENYPSLRIKQTRVQRGLTLPLHRQQCQIEADRLETLFNNWLGGKAFGKLPMKFCDLAILMMICGCQLPRTIATCKSCLGTNGSP